MTEVYKFTAKKYTVALYGPIRPGRDRELPIIYGGDPEKVCLIRSASDSTHQGFREIKNPLFGDKNNDKFDIYADGTILETSGSSAFMQTADCPSGFLFEHKSGRGILFHAGRPAMTPGNNSGDFIQNIVTEAYQILIADIKEPDVEAVIMGSICADCFLHTHADAVERIRPFERFGSIAFNDRDKGTLNLVRIIIGQLQGFGVKTENIRHDGICTFETPELASYRRDRSSSRNAVVAVLH